MALNSPYYEPFKKSEVPVLIINMHVDEMVFYFILGIQIIVKL
jgi:HSP90 family molecular chaperone